LVGQRRYEKEEIDTRELQGIKKGKDRKEEKDGRKEKAKKNTGDKTERKIKRRRN